MSVCGGRQDRTLQFDSLVRFVPPGRKARPKDKPMKPKKQALGRAEGRLVLRPSTEDGREAPPLRKSLQDQESLTLSSIRVIRADRTAAQAAAGAKIVAP